MLIHHFKLAWHFYCQEYHQSHQKLLRWVQAVLLLFIVTLSLTSYSIQHFLQQNLNGLLGADVVLSQKHPLMAQQLKTISTFTSKQVTTQQISTTLTHKGLWQQVQLKAVDQHYPLQGQLITSTSLQGEGESTLTGPRVGNIWLDARLFASLSVAIGEQLVIAGKTFVVEKIIQHEPDRLMEGHSVAMRAMINSADMQALNFSQDLIQYRYLLAAEPAQIDKLLTWQQKALPAAQMHHKQGRHPLALFWQRTENFIGLASIILFFMAAIAIEQLAQVHIKKDQYFSAVCMSLGASQTSGLQISIFKWLISTLLLLPVVLLAALGLHYLVIEFLSDTFANVNRNWQLATMLKSAGAVITVFAVFHAPVWLSLHNSSVAQQLLGQQSVFKQGLTKLSGLLVLIIIAYAYSDNGLLTFMMLAAIALSIALMIVMSWSALTVGEKATQRFSGLVPFALFMMKQRLVSKSTQILGVGLCAFLLLFTLMLLKDLGASMSAYQRQHDGNVFISQASSAQMQFIEQWAAEQNIAIRQSKPYMHAKLVAVNEQSLNEFSQSPSESLATFSKSIRLHWNDKLPENNRIISGKWWQGDGKHWQRISVEQEVLSDLGLALGDKLTFFINQKSYDFEITASHEFKPGAGSITFWVQMPTSALLHIQSAHYSMASMELAEQQWPLLAGLWQKFPSLRMVSLKEMTERFDRMLAMITKVIAGFAAMIIALALVVILASIKALSPREKQKNSVILSFGFARSTCLKLNLIEWLVTAVITAIGAIAGTYIAGLLIYQSQFSLNYQPDFIWLAITLISILSFVTLIGVYASRKSLNSSVRHLLASN
ncbi:ABC transporter permease [Thalassotalea sp. PLHSN55]|uniref:ABC transporter permease n=1 Tax=Thalassotalea sp. PLHSN55 TaxID=3435888 RepID=UPI003F829656